MPDSNRQDTVSKSSIKILIVDDDREVLSAISGLVCSLGYKTVTAENGPQAIECLKRGGIEIVITDILMPDMSGLQLLEYIRGHWPWPSIDVIVMTNHSNEYSPEDAIRAGAIDYIAKPFGMADLDAKLDRVVRERIFIRQLGKEIEARKQVEEQLRLHGEIMANMTEGVFLIRLKDGVIVYANPKFETMFGYEPDELFGKHVSIVNAPTEKNPEETAKEIIRVLNETGEWRGVVNNIRKDGTTFWCIANVSIFDHLQHGKVLVSVHRDISERKKAETAFKNIFNLSLDMISIADINGYFRKVNPAWTMILGYDEDELLEKSFLDFVHPDDKNKTLKVMAEKLSRGEAIFNFENRYKCKDGTYKWLEWLSRPILDEGITYSVARDVSNRKQTEAVLLESHERLLTVLNSLDAIVYVADMGTHELLFVNEYVQNIFGNIAGKVCWQTLQKNQTGPCDFCSNRYLLDTNGNPADRYVWEFQNTITGQWFQMVDRAIQWVDGRTVRLEIATDISDRKKAEEEKEKLIAELNKALDEIKTLRGIIPICSYCKQIRDDKGAWEIMEAYITKHTHAEFSHGICPICMKKHYPDFIDDDGDLKG